MPVEFFVILFRAVWFHFFLQPLKTIFLNENFLAVLFKNREFI